MALISCKECGKEISDSAATCPHCGVALKEQKVVIEESQSPSIRCPKCGSSNLQAISDVKGKGASFWKLCFCGLLGLCGAGKTKTEHYWACQNCGNKFKM